LLVVAVASPEDPDFYEHSVLAKEWADLMVTCPNRPLGRKTNFGIRACKELDWDYLMVLGSDDVASPNFLDAYEPVFEQRLPTWGWLDCHLHHKGQLYYWPGYGQRRLESIGAGRVVHRDVVASCGWKLVRDSLEKRLDSSMRRVLHAHGFEIPFGPLPKNTYLIDIKTEVNITPFERFRRDRPRPIPTPSEVTALLEHE
jgi:hypothetical protein